MLNGFLPFSGWLNFRLISATNHLNELDSEASPTINSSE